MAQMLSVVLFLGLQTSQRKSGLVQVGSGWLVAVRW